MKKIVSRMIQFTFVCAFFALGNQCFAVDTNELQLLKDKVEKAKLERELAEEKQKELAAMLPKTETKALDGKITVEGLAIEVDLLANQALSEIASNIAIKVSPSSSLLICGQSDFDSLQKYESVVSQLKLLKASYGNIYNELDDSVKVAPLAIGAGLEAANSIVRSVIDLLALFRTDVDIKGRVATLDESVLIAEIARRVTGTPVFYPKLFLPIETDSSEIMGLIRDIEEVRAAIAGKRKEIEAAEKKRAAANPPKEATQVAALQNPVDDKKGKPSKSETGKDKPAKPEAGKDKPATPDEDNGRPAKPDDGKETGEAAQTDDEQSQDPVVALLQELDKGFAALKTALLAADKGNIIDLCRAEQLKKLSTSPGSSFLVVKIVSAGGNNVTKKNLITGSKLLHSGGCIAYFIQIKPTGQILSSGAFNAYAGYFQSRLSSKGQLEDYLSGRKPTTPRFASPKDEGNR